MLVIFLPWAILADQDSEESRLLKSWGMQFDTQGKLRFQPVKKPSKYSPWKPDLSAYQQIKSTQTSTEMLKPLVISSRNRAPVENAKKVEK